VCAKREKPVPIGFSAVVVRDTCLGLHYAHAFVEPSGKPAPVIHRDVSPKNVMVTYQGNIKVIDFGIAKAKGRLGRTQVGIVKGTSGYMSPEQVRGEPLDGRSDLFAAGVILYELVTEQRLFTAPNDASMMIKIAEGQIPDPHTLNPKVSRPLSDVIMRALQRPREERFATGKEMARALEGALASELFDEDQTAALMKELFEDRVNKTRALLDVAMHNNGEQLDAVAGELRDEGEPAHKLATPKPRGAKAPVVRPEPLDEPTPAPPPRAVGPQRYASKVASDYALYNDADVDTVQEPARHPTDEVSVGDPQARRLTDEVPANVTNVRPKILRGSAVNRGWGGRTAALAVLTLCAGLAVSTRAGPLQPYVRPLSDRLVAWVQEQTAGEPLPPPPEPLKKSGILPPQAVSLIQKQQAEAEEERSRTEAAARSPEPSPVRPEPTKDRVADERTKDKVKKTSPNHPASKRGSPASTANTTVVQRPEGEAEVLNTRSKAGAARDGLGWLSLFTVPPAQVFDGATNLGVSPLVKVPLPSGTYRLRLVDPDGLNRMLSVPIKPGEIQTMKIRVGDLPLDN
jgi:serine/threonine protein kinase, bacterial